MAAGLAARRLGAESPLHFGVAPQSTPRSARLRRRRPIHVRVTAAEPSRAPSLSISFRALRCIRLARGTPTSGSRTAGRLLFESPSPKPARLQVDQPPALPMGCAEPRGGAHARRPADSGVAIEGASVAAAAWRGERAGAKDKDVALGARSAGSCHRGSAESRLRAQVRPVAVTAVAAAAPAAAVAHEITGSDYEDDFEEYDSE